MHYLSENPEELVQSGESRGKQWFVVHTKPRQEALAQENLLRQNFDVYYPLIKLTRRRKSDLLSVIEPFFPRYIFLRFDLTRDNWGPVRSTRGVCGLVKFNGVPKPVPAALIRAMKENENTDKLQIVSNKTWKPGELVEIEQGPFVGYHCIFQAQKSADRVCVLLDIVGKRTRATLLKRDLQLPKFA